MLASNNATISEVLGVRTSVYKFLCDTVQPVTVASSFGLLQGKASDKIHTKFFLEILFRLIFLVVFSWLAQCPELISKHLPFTIVLTLRKKQ